MSPEEALTLAGQALHGRDHWRLPLARDLSIDDDTLRRWLRRPGTLTWQHGALKDLLNLLDNQAAVLAALAADVRACLE